MKRAPSKKVKTELYLECPGCNINSLTKDRMCPCPRGECEAEVVGKIITTVEVVINEKKKSKAA